MEVGADRTGLQCSCSAGEKRGGRREREGERAGEAAGRMRQEKPRGECEAEMKLFRDASVHLWRTWSSGGAARAGSSRINKQPAGPAAAQALQMS